MYGTYYAVIALWVLYEDNTHGPINWFSQFFTFGYWRWLNRWSFKPSLIFSKSITTFTVVNKLSLNFQIFSQRPTTVDHCLLTLPHLERTSTHKTKNHHFLGDGWYCLCESYLPYIYTISTNTHSQFLVNVYQRLLSICVLTTTMLLIYITHFN